MSDPAEIVSALFILFIGSAVVAMTWVSTQGGDVTPIADFVQTLAGPFVLILILIFFGLSIIGAGR